MDFKVDLEWWDQPYRLIPVKTKKDKNLKIIKFLTNKPFFSQAQKYRAWLIFSLKFLAEMFSDKDLR